MLRAPKARAATAKALPALGLTNHVAIVTSNLSQDLPGMTEHMTMGKYRVPREALHCAQHPGDEQPISQQRAQETGCGCGMSWGPRVCITKHPVLTCALVFCVGGINACSLELSSQRAHVSRTNTSCEARLLCLGGSQEWLQKAAFASRWPLCRATLF